jgi:vacuolar-type H+-ATPase subunit H
MKLPEVLDILLKAGDEAMETRAAAEQEAKALIQKTHEKFAAEQEARLNAARGEARALVESTRQSVEMEALHIAELAQKSRDSMREHFEANVSALISGLADKVAAGYAARGQRGQN